MDTIRRLIALVLLVVAVPTWGAMTLEDSDADINTSNSTTITLTLADAPTDDNLLVLACSARDRLTGNTISLSGFTEAASGGGTTEDEIVWILYKIAASEASASYTVTFGDNEENACWLGEYSGNTTTSVLDVTANNSELSNDGNVSTGTTGSTAQADNLAVAVIGWIGSGHTSLSWSNSFAQKTQQDGSNDFDSSLAVATKDLTSIGTVETTLSWTGGTADANAAAIAVFKESGGGGGTPRVPRKPIFMN